jgi:hypothetical protein
VWCRIRPRRGPSPAVAHSSIAKSPSEFAATKIGRWPISRAIGQRPIFVAGNSDGDFAMLEWATAGDGPRLGLILHHTDAAREWAYDRDSHVGRLERGLDEGPERGWLIVDMVSDWRTVFAEQD